MYSLRLWIVNYLIAMKARVLSSPVEISFYYPSPLMVEISFYYPTPLGKLITLLADRLAYQFALHALHLYNAYAN